MSARIITIYLEQWNRVADREREDLLPLSQLKARSRLAVLGASARQTTDEGMYPVLIEGETDVSAAGERAMIGPEEHPDLEPDISVEREIKEPPQYRVILHNDDYTTMEFVVYVLQTVFYKEETEAVQIMLMVHRNGSGVCGIYTAEVAETKVSLVHDMARKHGYPLKCSMQEV